MRKVRIIALYIQYRDGVPDEDRRRLYQHARLTLSEQDAVNALEHLGVRISRVSYINSLDRVVVKHHTGSTRQRYQEENQAKAVCGGRVRAVSLQASIEICN